MTVVSNKKITFNLKDFKDYLNKNVDTYDKKVLSTYIHNFIGIRIRHTKFIETINNLFKQNPNRNINLVLD